MLLAALQQEAEFGAWKSLDGLKLRFGLGASVSTGKIGDATVQIAQPNTYMNESGRPAATIARRHQLPLSRILVVHDDLDLAVGRVKLKRGGSSGGHRGINSCEECLAGRDFWRLRIGIGRPANKADVPDFVLEQFDASDAVLLDRCLRQIVGALPLLLGAKEGEITQASSSAFLNAVARPLPTAATAAASDAAPAGASAGAGASGPTDAGASGPAAAPAAAASEVLAEPPPLSSGISHLVASIATSEPEHEAASKPNDDEPKPPKRSRSGAERDST